MENKGEIIAKPAKTGTGRSRKDITATCITYWLLASMFYIELLVNIIGITYGKLSFMPIVVGVGIIGASVCTLLALLEMKKLKRAR